MRLKRGFTLIELLVVIGILSILGAIGTDIFLNVTRSYNKANIIVEIEQNANIAFSQMAQEIRSARSVSPTSGVTSTLTIIDEGGASVVYSFVPQTETQNGYLARNGIPLTDTGFSSGVNVTVLSFTVVEADPAVVSITMTLTQPLGAPGRIDYQASATLKTTVSLRTY